MTTPDSPWLTLDQAAPLLHVSTRALSEYIASKEIPESAVLKLGRRVFILRSWVYRELDNVSRFPAVATERELMALRMFAQYVSVIAAQLSEAADLARPNDPDDLVRFKAS
jgi:dTDP-4-dehydrorhamnose reductase